MLDVCLLGTGGMLPLPDRALTALYVRHKGRVLLIDCGEGTQIAVRRAGLRFKPIDAILITHFHADHISGLPGLLLTMGNEGRTETVTLYGPAGLGEIVKSLCVIAPEIPFPLEICELPCDEVTGFSCIGLELNALPLEHRVPCLGYAMHLPRSGKFDAAKARARGVPQKLWKILQQGKAAGSFVPADVLGEPRRGLRLLYATDTRPLPILAEYGKDADLLVLEGIFGAAEKQQRAEDTCHMTMREAADIARAAEAKALWLTHFSPAMAHPEEFSDKLRAIFPQTEVGYDGMKVTLQFEK